ncbi:MAG: hypothetical protein R3253_02050 [Longimicrobiales bacterium]|nr:hypothetical protein [Longimicrobiales bacterium]
MATGLPRAEIEAALDALMGEERVEVSVSETAVLVYRLRERRQPLPPSGPATMSSGGSGLTGPDRRGGASSSSSGRLGRWSLAGRRWGWRSGDRTQGSAAFDRKTLRLIRARGGVVSLAELVEHTGLTVDGVRAEVERLARLYGGEAHPSWDGHVVYAFPDLVESAHGDFHVREPRPAWVRNRDPLQSREAPDPAVRLALVGLGAVSAGLLAWFATFPPGGWGRVVILAAVAGASAGAAFATTRSLLRWAAQHPLLRPYRSVALRRYVLGYVFETALRGKGVVSLSRTVSYLRTRTGSRRVRRRTVEKVLRQLAREFDATISELDGDFFFGFRNVKRQFLASHVQRVRLQLGRRAAGPTIFDSGDSELAAARRELDAFDRELQKAPDPSKGPATGPELR